MTYHDTGPGNLNRSNSSPGHSSQSQNNIPPPHYNILMNMAKSFLNPAPNAPPADAQIIQYIQQHPDAILTIVIIFKRHSNNHFLKILCLSMIRQCVVNMWALPPPQVRANNQHYEIPEPIKAELRSALPLLCLKEPEDNIADLIGVILGKIVRHDFPSRWPNVLNVCNQFITSNKPGTVPFSRSCLIFSNLLENLVSKKLPHHKKQFQQAIASIYPSFMPILDLIHMCTQKTNPVLSLLTKDGVSSYDFFRTLFSSGWFSVMTAAIHILKCVKIIIVYGFEKESPNHAIFQNVPKITVLIGRFVEIRRIYIQKMLNWNSIFCWSEDTPWSWPTEKPERKYLDPSYIQQLNNTTVLADPLLYPIHSCFAALDDFFELLVARNRPAASKFANVWLDYCCSNLQGSTTMCFVLHRARIFQDLTLLFQLLEPNNEQEDLSSPPKISIVRVQFIYSSLLPFLSLSAEDYSGDNPTIKYVMAEYFTSTPTSQSSWMRRKARECLKQLFISFPIDTRLIEKKLNTPEDTFEFFLIVGDLYLEKSHLFNAQELLQDALSVINMCLGILDAPGNYTSLSSAHSLNSLNQAVSSSLNSWLTGSGSVRDRDRHGGYNIASHVAQSFLGHAPSSSIGSIGSLGSLGGSSYALSSTPSTSHNASPEGGSPPETSICSTPQNPGANLNCLLIIHSCWLISRLVDGLVIKPNSLQEKMMLRAPIHYEKTFLLRKPIYSMILALFERPLPLAVQISAAYTLRSLVDDMYFDVKNIQPLLGNFFNKLFELAHNLPLDGKLNVLDTAIVLIERTGSRIAPFSSNIKCPKIKQY